MKIGRIIVGPILSIIFLVFFAYLIAGVQWVFDNSLQKQNGALSLGSISGFFQGTSNQDPNKNVIKIISVENPELELGAGAAISVESDLFGTNNVIFEKNANTQLPIASLTKLMTAVIVLDNYNMSDTVVVGKTAGAQDPRKQDLKIGDVLSVENFLDIMLVGSSNISAYALSEIIGEQKFVELMNQRAIDMGLKDTFFADPTGLSSKNVSTASDLAKFAEYIIKNYPKISSISKVEEMYIPKFGNIINTNQLLGEFPEIVCSKTGFTSAASGCLLMVVNNPKNNNYLINVILGSSERFYEMKKLISWSDIVCNQ